MLLFSREHCSTLASYATIASAIAKPKALSLSLFPFHGNPGRTQLRNYGNPLRHGKGQCGSTLKSNWNLGTAFLAQFLCQLIAERGELGRVDATANSIHTHFRERCLKGKERKEKEETWEFTKKTAFARALKVISGLPKSISEATPFGMDSW